jgi:hypothetical protein
MTLTATRPAVTLPFASRTESGTDYWTVAETGDWSADNRTGRAHADALVEQMHESGFPGTLAHVVRAMVDHGAVGGVEIGFLNRIAEHAIG